MRLKIVIASIVVLFPFVGTGQTYFNVLLPDTHLFAFVNVIPQKDKYLALGAGFNPLSRTFFVYEFDKKGNLNWYRPFGTPPEIYGGETIYELGNGFVVSGSARSSSGAQTDFFVARLNQQGDSIWYTRIYHPQHELIRDAIVTKQGTTILTGSVEYSSPSEDYSLGAVDSSGKVLWEKTYGDPGIYEEPRSVIQTADGGFVLSGVKGPDDKWDIWVVKTDSVGKTQWNKTYGGDFEDFGGFMAETTDGNLILIFNSDTTSNRKTTQLRILKLDGSNGNILFQKIYSEFHDAFFLTKPIVNNDGTIVAGGGGYIPEDDDNDPVGLVIKVSQNGELIWSREYHNLTDRDNYIYDLKPTVDSGYVFCGSSSKEHGGLSKGWIVKLDCHGNDSITYYEPDSACVIYSNVTYYQSPVNKQIYLYPNPTDNFVQVEFPEQAQITHITLLSATGRLVHRQETLQNANSTRVDLSLLNLPAGLYWVKLQGINGITYAKKLLVK